LTNLFATLEWLVGEHVHKNSAAGQQFAKMGAEALLPPVTGNM